MPRLVRRLLRKLVFMAIVGAIVSLFQKESGKGVAKRSRPGRPRRSGARTRKAGARARRTAHPAR